MKHPHHEYDGLVFDLNGTFANTMPTHSVAWSQSMAEYELMLSEERFYALGGGLPASEIIDLLAKEQRQVVGAVAITESKETLFIVLLGTVQPVIPVQAFADFHREHLPMAIAVGSPKWAAEQILQSLGIRDWFRAVVGSECVTNSKLAADAYLRAAELINSAVILLNDTALNIQAAQNAGMVVVDIHTLL